MHFRARLAEERIVDRGADRVRQGSPKARPPGAAVELGRRREKIEIAAGATIDAGPMFVLERARPWGLGRLLPEDRKLQGLMMQMSVTENASRSWGRSATSSK
jgi:hypothetical protein